MDQISSFGDQQIAGDVLTSQKYTTELYNKFALEAKKQELRNDFLKILNQEHEIQVEMFELMEEKGWYPIEMAEDKKIEDAINTFKG